MDAQFQEFLSSATESELRSVIQRVQGYIDGDMAPNESATGVAKWDVDPITNRINRKMCKGVTLGDVQLKILPNVRGNPKLVFHTNVPITVVLSVCDKTDPDGRRFELRYVDSRIKVDDYVTISKQRTTIIARALPMAPSDILHHLNARLHERQHGPGIVKQVLQSAAVVRVVKNAHERQERFARAIRLARPGELSRTDWFLIGVGLLALAACMAPPAADHSGKSVNQRSDAAESSLPSDFRQVKAAEMVQECQRLYLLQEGIVGLSMYHEHIQNTGRFVYDIFELYFNATYPPYRCLHNLTERLLGFFLSSVPTPHGSLVYRAFNDDRFPEDELFGLAYLCKNSPLRQFRLLLKGDKTKDDAVVEIIVLKRVREWMDSRFLRTIPASTKRQQLKYALGLNDPDGLWEALTITKV